MVLGLHILGQSQRLRTAARSENHCSSMRYRGMESNTRTARPMTSFKTAWTKVRDKGKVVGRWHDNRHTLVTELAESGAGDEVIMSIAGHVPRAMLSRYSHVRMEAKRRALDEIAVRQRTADEKRKEEAGRQRRDAVASQSLVLQ
jgi:hypothetical protein